MITIDRIVFEFAMNDEPFAHSLYADWNDFCRDCFEKVVEEYFEAYDKDRVLHEIDTLDLDLGSIPQEDFYAEFPRRLKEKLLKALPSLPLEPSDKEDMQTIASRFANLLYYLEHGALKAEWADVDFNLSEELSELMIQDKRYLEKIAGLCMTNEYVLRRLLLQTDNAALLIRFYSMAMDRAFSVKDGRRRFMEIFLEMQPDVPVRFVHEVEEDGRLHGMAEHLDTRSVRRIMEKEIEEHAEVDLPPYWHYLYEWLIKYYPFNGLAVFGGKSNFIDHLHYRLLTFIRKRNNTLYLSKTELTAAFLLEVFGAAYYKEVLSTIYNMQPQNADGSPAYGGYYNYQLYLVFMRLSLLRLPETPEDVVDVNLKNQTTKIGWLSKVFKDSQRSEADKRRLISILIQEKPDVFVSLKVIDLLSHRWNRSGSFMEWLKDTTVETGYKRELLQTLALEKPQELLQRLRILPQGEETVSLMATHIPMEALLAVVQRTNAKQALLLSRTIDLLQRERGRFALLSTMTMPFTTALSEALLLFMQDKDTLSGRNLTEQEVIAKFLSYLYYTYTRKMDYNSNAEWKKLQQEVTGGLALNGANTGAVDDTADLPFEMFTDETLPQEVRKRLLRDYIRSRPAELLSYIQQLVKQDKTPMDQWAQWADLSDWLRLTASVSLTLEELLRQLVENLLTKGGLINEASLKHGLLTFIAVNDVARFAYFVDKAEVVSSFLLSLSPIQQKTEEEKKAMVSQLMQNLGITSEEERLLRGGQEDEPEIALIDNAGLCLLSPWFPRLFDLLGYLNEEKRSFKDTASRIRAVFLLQYLACPEEMEYREPELVFNRMLVALPTHIPLPKRIELTDKEKQTADGLLEGVKANWTKMSGTSVSGFRQSFVLRRGRLQQQDEKCLLTVESRVYDILLDEIPWAFRQIRFPWLKKYIQVFWHEKQEF